MFHILCLRFSNYDYLQAESHSRHQSAIVGEVDEELVDVLRLPILEELEGVVDDAVDEAEDTEGGRQPPPGQVGQGHPWVNCQPLGGSSVEMSIFSQYSILQYHQLKQTLTVLTAAQRPINSFANPFVYIAITVNQ